MPSYSFTCAGCAVSVTVKSRSEALRRRYCNSACYHRAKRVAETKNGYRVRTVSRDHPLSNGNNQISEHRAVLWDRIGPGAHPCHYCGTAVEWRTGTHAWHGALIAEHLDRDPGNNDPSNIVAACQPCNIRNQARTVADHEPHVITSAGTRRRAVPHICARPECGAEFLDSPHFNRKYCSLSCYHATRRGQPRPTGQPQAARKKPAAATTAGRSTPEVT